MVERTPKELKQDISQKKTPTPSPETPSRADDLMDLQRVIGNQAMQRLMGQADGQSRPATFIQTKLTVGAADDAYEREADAVAHQVMSTPDTASAGESVQRAGEEDELMTKRLANIQRAGEEDELATKRLPEIVQRVGEEDELATSRDDMMGSFEVGGDVENQIQTSKGGGQPLPDSTRSFLEPRFGQDFSSVRVHTGGEADSLNRSLSARAFTTGSDIFVRSSDYQPDSAGGRELLAHELTHVVQQTGGKPQAQPKREEE
jgi:uncharacterized protein DUF4157